MRLGQLPLPAPAFRPAQDIAASDQPQPSPFEVTTDLVGSCVI